MTNQAMQPTVVLNVVGLTQRMIGPDTPNLLALSRGGGMRHLTTVSPAVTCSAQATFLTGVLPRQHGIVGNGWYFRDLSEIWFWRQSNALVTGEPVWDAAKAIDSGFTCANMFWWYNMYSSSDIGVTPRPMYLADGRKLPDCYTAPAELRTELTQLLGTFPLFSLWGPATMITSSEWIARASIHVRRTRRPTLTLVYLPHLDYGLQRMGPDHPSIADGLARHRCRMWRDHRRHQKGRRQYHHSFRVRHHPGQRANSHQPGLAPGRFACRPRGTGPRTA